MNLIQSTILNAWTSGRKVKKNNKGWLSGNAPCCIHNGESMDKRGRGGLLVTNNSTVIYKCFNCQYTTGWAPGRHLSYKFRNLMSWMGADEGDIRRLVLVAMEMKDAIPEEDIPQYEPIVSFPKSQLPNRSEPLTEDSIAYEYLIGRGLNINDHPFYMSKSLAKGFNKRLIIPFYHNGDVVGYTARHIGNGIPKYLNEMPHGYVFNLDNQIDDRDMVVVVEGVLDAISIDAVSILGNEINDIQIDLIERLNRQIVVVPDGDEAGGMLVDKAVELGWNVSYPVWLEEVKDVNAAIKEYGRLFTVKAIVDSIEHNPVKIKLLKRRFCE